MATPQMQVQQLNFQALNGSPLSLRCKTFNADGTPLDVHTGYTVLSFNALPQANPNTYSTATNIGANMTPAFDATGVTLTCTEAQSIALVDSLPSFNMLGVLRLSNDAGTTNAVAARVNINVDQSSLDS